MRNITIQHNIYVEYHILYFMKGIIFTVLAKFTKKIMRTVNVVQTVDTKEM